MCRSEDVGDCCSSAAVVSQAPEGDRFEFTLGDHDRDAQILEKRRGDARHEVQHVRSTRRAEVLLPGSEIAGRIGFEVRVIPAQSVFANLIGAGMEGGNKDPGVISSFAADDLAGRQRIDPSESRL